MPIAFARMQTVIKNSARPMLDKIDYIARRGRHAARGGLVAGPITVLPPGAPQQYRNERLLWADAETAERFGYVVAQEILMALPSSVEISTAGARQICRTIAKEFTDEYGVAVSYAIHSDAIEPEWADNSEQGLPNGSAHTIGSNDHVHFLLGSRQLSQDGFSAKRHNALLPNIGGRGFPNSTAIAKVHAVDATNFRALARRHLERYFARTGRPISVRLEAIHAGYHVGPVAAVRALANDVEALARRPDAAAIIRKIERLRVNSKIDMLNAASIRDIEPLIEHLAERIFTRVDVETLVRRHCPDARLAGGIVNTVMGRSLIFTAPNINIETSFHIMPEYRDREGRIALLARGLDDKSTARARHTEIATTKALADQIEVGHALSLLDLTSRNHANALAELSAMLAASGRTVVMATHLNKRREPPGNIPLRALHWSGKFILPPAAVVLVDEADSLRLMHLEKLLLAAVEAKAQIVFCRRSYQSDVAPHPTLSEILSRNLVTLGQPKAPSNQPLFGDLRRKVQFVENQSTLADNAFQFAIACQKRGRKIFFLCGDPLLTAEIEKIARRTRRTILVGRLVPEDWKGAVVVLHSRLTLAPHLRSIAALQPHFLVPKSVAEDLDQFQRHLRLSLGLVTTLTDFVRPYAVMPRLKHQNAPVPGTAPDWASIDNGADVSSVAILKPDEMDAESAHDHDVIFEKHDDRDDLDTQILLLEDVDDDDPNPDDFEPDPGWDDDPDDGLT